MGSPLLVEAGPGSGKTEVVIERVKFLTDKGGFDPSEILCITFTVKAAEEMRNRLEEDGIDTSQMTIMNYHAFYHELLEKNKSYTGLGNSKIISRATLLVWALENIDSFKFNDEIDISQNSISLEIEAIIDGISTFRDSLLSPEELQQYIAKKKFPMWTKEMKLLKSLESELDLPFYYDLHILAKKKLIRLDKTDKIIARLKKKKFKVSRTHFCQTGLKTDWKV